MYLGKKIERTDACQFLAWVVTNHSSQFLRGKEQEEKRTRKSDDMPHTSPDVSHDCARDRGNIYTLVPAGQEP